MDGNFKAEHLKDRKPDDQIWLMDGHGFMVGRTEYKCYLEGTPSPLEVCYQPSCNTIVAYIKYRLFLEVFM